MYIVMSVCCYSDFNEIHGHKIHLDAISDVAVLNDTMLLSTLQIDND